MKYLFLSLFFSISILVPSLALADSTTVPPKTSSVQLINPLTGAATTKDPAVLIGNIINAVLGVVGSLALAMFIYGGLTWMLAAGNDQRVQKGKDILLWATIGLVVIFSSYALVRFVFVGLGFPQ